MVHHKIFWDKDNGEAKGCKSLSRFVPCGMNCIAVTSLFYLLKTFTLCYAQTKVNLLSLQQ